MKEAFHGLHKWQPAVRLQILLVKHQQLISYNLQSGTLNTCVDSYADIDIDTRRGFWVYDFIAC